MTGVAGEAAARPAALELRRGRGGVTTRSPGLGATSAAAPAQSPGPATRPPAPGTAAPTPTTGPAAPLTTDAMKARETATVTATAAATWSVAATTAGEDPLDWTAVNSHKEVNITKTIYCASVHILYFHCRLQSLLQQLVLLLLLQPLQ